MLHIGQTINLRTNRTIRELHNIAPSLLYSSGLNPKPLFCVDNCCPYLCILCLYTWCSFALSFLVFVWFWYVSMHVFEHVGVILCVINLVYVFCRVYLDWGSKIPQEIFTSSSYLNFYSSKFVVASLLFYFAFDC